MERNDSLKPHSMSKTVPVWKSVNYIENYWDMRHETRVNTLGWFNTWLNLLVPSTLESRKPDSWSGRQSWNPSNWIKNWSNSYFFKWHNIQNHMSFGLVRLWKMPGIGWQVGASGLRWQTFGASQRRYKNKPRIQSRGPTTSEGYWRRRWTYKTEDDSRQLQSLSSSSRWSFGASIFSGPSAHDSSWTREKPPWAMERHLRIYPLMWLKQKWVKDSGWKLFVATWTQTEILIIIHEITVRVFAGQRSSSPSTLLFL